MGFAPAKGYKQASNLKSIRSEPSSLALVIFLIGHASNISFTKA